MRSAALAALASAWLLVACVQPRPLGLLDISERPAEKALLAGLKAYDEAQYDPAKKLFAQSLDAGLASPRDRAEAHKRLAFIECAASRMAECEAEFRLARQADPKFALDRSEAGHPVWGSVYRKTLP
ncbi:MAG: TssQ family T6SS-associated lipoprotein [Pseudomonadota bacterium]|nr:TssQ family T6SS-associated lipoprotein [Pseudomonadota bacterium]